MDHKSGEPSQPRSGANTSGSAGWLPPSVEELQALLPQYEIESLIGHGGMGAVYRGQQGALQRPVAIKLLPETLAENDDGCNFVERFKLEARSMANLDHPAIISVYDFGQTSEGHLYFVMEFIDGMDMHKYIHLSGGSVEPGTAVAIVSHVLDALNYAHSKGIVHRDIKPANVLINREGKVKIADFGLAKQLAGDDEPAVTGLTMSNVALGTPDFVAPEALDPDASPDHRADLYAVGIMLYQMLTGKVPRGIFKLPSEENAEIDPRLDDILTLAMESNPDGRFQSATEFRMKLDELASAPVEKISPDQDSAAVETPAEALDFTEPGLRKSESVRRHPVRKAASKKKSTIPLVLTVVGALAVGGLLFWWIAGSGDSEDSTGLSAAPDPVEKKVESPVATVSAPESSENSSAEEGWISLFNGNDLEGWKTARDTIPFAVEEGAIVASIAGISQNSFRNELYREETYTDFELEYEIKEVGGLNAGFQIRSQLKRVGENAPITVAGPQIEFDPAKGFSGYLWGEEVGGGWIGSRQPSEHSFLRKNDFNQFRVVAEGDRIRTWLNGHPVAEVDISGHPERDAMRSGLVGLAISRLGTTAVQDAKVFWRNIRIRPVEPDATRSNISVTEEETTISEPLVLKNPVPEKTASDGEKAGGQASSEISDMGNSDSTVATGDSNQLSEVPELLSAITSHQTDRHTQLSALMGKYQSALVRAEEAAIGAGELAQVEAVQTAIQRASSFSDLIAALPEQETVEPLPSLPPLGSEAPAELKRLRGILDSEVPKIESSLNAKFQGDLESLQTALVESKRIEEARIVKDWRIANVGGVFIGPSSDSAGLGGKWTELFNGKDLSGWNVKSGFGEFKVANGEIVGEIQPGSPNTFLCTDAKFGDFELEYEAKLGGMVNSGVQVRSKLKDVSKNAYGGVVFGPQVELERSPGMSGYLYGEQTGTGWISESPAENTHFDNTKFNHFRIVAEGPRIKTWVNGEPVEDLNRPDLYSQFPSGFVALQVHRLKSGAGGTPVKIHWKNIRIRPLNGGDADARPAKSPVVAKAGPTEWTDSFSEANLQGWKTLGDPNAFRLEGDALRAGKQGRPSLLLWTGGGSTPKSVRNFEMSFRARSEGPGANSGVYFHIDPSLQMDARKWPEQGNEVQLALSNAEGVHATGGLYNVAEPRISVRSTDRWKEYRIRVEDSRVQTWVDGRQALDYTEPSDLPPASAHQHERISPVGGAIAIQANSRNGAWLFDDVVIRTW